MAPQHSAFLSEELQRDIAAAKAARELHCHTTDELPGRHASTAREGGSSPLALALALALAKKPQ